MIQLDTDNTNFLNGDHDGAVFEIQLVENEVYFNFTAIVEIVDFEFNDVEVTDLTFNWATTDVAEVDATPTREMREAAAEAAEEMFREGDF